MRGLGPPDGCPVGGRRGPGGSLEDPRQMTLAGEAAGRGNLDDWRIPLKQDPCPFQSLSLDPALRRDTMARAEHALKVEGAEIRQARQLIQPERGAQARLDVLADPAPQMWCQAPLQRWLAQALPWCHRHDDGFGNSRLSRQRIVPGQGRCQMVQGDRQARDITEGQVRQDHQPRIAVEGLGEGPAQLGIWQVEVNKGEAVGDLPFR